MTDSELLPGVSGVSCCASPRLAAHRSFSATTYRGIAAKQKGEADAYLLCGMGAECIFAGAILRLIQFCLSFLQAALYTSDVFADGLELIAAGKADHGLDQFGGGACVNHLKGTAFERARGVGVPARVRAAMVGVSDVSLRVCVLGRAYVCVRSCLCVRVCVCVMGGGTYFLLQCFQLL